MEPIEWQTSRGFALAWDHCPAPYTLIGFGQGRMVQLRKAMQVHDRRHCAVSVR